MATIKTRVVLDYRCERRGHRWSVDLPDNSNAILIAPDFKAPDEPLQAVVRVSGPTHVPYWLDEGGNVTKRRPPYWK